MITSPSNPRIKAVKKLKDRKTRQETGEYFIEGIRIVIEALEESNNIVEIIVAPELLKSDSAKKAVKTAEILKIPITEVSSDVFLSISDKDGPQGLGAILKQRFLGLPDISLPLDGIWIALNAIADPGNLGTIIRTLDGMGGKGVILIGQCTDPTDPAVIRASMGAVFSKLIVKTSTREFITWVESTGIQLIGTSDAGRSDYRDTVYDENMVLLSGSEREGLPSELLRACDSVVSIPMSGKGDSLNLAVASSIVLYEIRNQHPIAPESRIR
jgi:RNA methyltransferase, TrmH family